MYITARTERTEQVESAIRRFLGEGQRTLSGSQYSRRAHKHIITQQLAHFEDDLDSLYAGVVYDAMDHVASLRVPRQDQREKEFLAAVTDIDARWDISINIEFAFSEVDEASLWFPLPSWIGGTGDASDTFRITGVRATKYASQDDVAPEFTFSLDRDPDGDLLLDLYFSTEGKFTLDLPSRELARGVTIAERLVGIETVRRRLTK